MLQGNILCFIRKVDCTFCRLRRVSLFPEGRIVMKIAAGAIGSLIRGGRGMPDVMGR